MQELHGIVCVVREEVCGERSICRVNTRGRVFFVRLLWPTGCESLEIKYCEEELAMIII